MKSKLNSCFSNLKKNVFTKQFAVFCIFMFVSAVPMFAAGNGESIVELDNWAEKILELFQSSWVKALLLVALIVEAIGMVLAGQQGGGGQMIKKFAPWIIGTIILLSASSICSYFLGDLSFEVAMAPMAPPADITATISAIG